MLRFMKFIILAAIICHAFSSLVLLYFGWSFTGYFIDKNIGDKFQSLV